MKVKIRILVFFIHVFISLGFGGSFQKIFNGINISGWHHIGEGNFFAEDSILKGTLTGGYGHLVSDSIYNNFTFRFKYQAISEITGFYFRSEEGGGSSGVAGYKVAVDKIWTGGLWESHGRGWIFEPTPEQHQQWVRENDWNEVVVTAYGEHITLTVNGIKTVDTLDTHVNARSKGVFAIQLHSGNGVEGWFKDIEMADTTREGCTDSLANNFDPWAFQEDGSCLLPLNTHKISTRQKIIFQNGYLFFTPLPLSISELFLYSINGEKIKLSRYYNRWNPINKLSSGIYQASWRDSKGNFKKQKIIVH